MNIGEEMIMALNTALHFSMESRCAKMMTNIIILTIHYVMICPPGDARLGNVVVVLAPIHNVHNAYVQQIGIVKIHIIQKTYLSTSSWSSLQ